MKKAIVASMLALLVLTGCGKKETVECTNTQKSYGVELDSKITVELNNNKFVNLVMTIDAILPESYFQKKYINILIIVRKGSTKFNKILHTHLQRLHLY